ncbi:Rpn family recombination-promoting nuclease/putative transposase [Dyadobacter sp. CY261]|uniref:Rpn family recombination-promoting nuclease/putative transposase n=1 Tax=Dyadobacter sp. CY261 TaxID=2907203 RepID=UPI001F33AD1B|nr:Rpn family recombination-promoting nuclease/putative transposase [Dyadobacter sp. CY261]MCF0074588.1 Rpn family recombination-promoting nuclease/putative transposase [Dyadobacter sp. CY261]
MKRNDILWKSILEDIFDDFLRFFFPNADTLFDLERGFEYLDQELDQLFPPVSDACATRYVDKLVKVYCRSGAEAWLLVHIEVQGYRDDTFADRMFTYYYRIWDKYRKPTTAFAILTDDCKHYLPYQFEQACLGTSLCFKFNSFKVLDQSEEVLSESDNPFAQAVLITKTALIGKRLSVEELYRLKIQLAKRLLNRNIPKWKIGRLMNFLQFYVRLGNRELDVEFDLEIDRVVDQNKIPMTFEETILMIVKEEGLEQGISQERLARNTAFVRNLLCETKFSQKEIARLVGVTVAFVREVKRKL